MTQHFSNHPLPPAPAGPAITPRSRNFASDNASGICPEAWAAMAEANAAGHCPSYGADAYTTPRRRRLRECFETDCDVYFVFNGTAANSLALASLCQSYHAVVCHETAHIETDECGAPEFFSGGSKLLACPGALGKLTPDVVRDAVRRRTGHSLPPAARPVADAADGTGHGVRRGRADGPHRRRQIVRPACALGRRALRQRGRVARRFAGRN